MQKKKIKTRGQCIGAIILLLFFVLLHRFYTLQVVEASWLQERTHQMYQREKVLEAERGSIYDRHQNVLATEIKAYTVVAILDENEPNHVKDPDETADRLAPLLEMPREKLYDLLTQTDVQQVELRPGGWKIDQEKMEKISQLGLEGITFVEERKRLYPNHTFASHVLGYVDLDGQARMGLELALDEHLTGEDGLFRFKQNRRGQRLMDSAKTIAQPQDGYDVYLTLDERIQLYVEQALDDVYHQYHPEKMMMIVSNPHTGEILAMANRPAFDPNQYSSITNYWNDAVSNAFEPGSTFKVITFAAAIEEGLYNGNEYFQSGSFQVPGQTIHDHNRHGWGSITFLEGMQKSSNVAAVILGYQRMKKEVFYHYLDRFGFGHETGIDLPGEAAGYIRPADSVQPAELASMTFGQGLMVTPIQMIQAINVIANGGQLLKPYIIDSIYDPNTGRTVMKNQPEVVDPQVISPETAKEMRDILETVVTRGTGTNFHIEGYQVAGKTGTAQKAKENGKGYQEGKYIHSFVGFAPKDDPILSIFVAIDSPQVSEYYIGGALVAQVFKYVMENSLQYLNVERQAEVVEIAPIEEEWITVEDYRGLSIDEAEQKAGDRGFRPQLIGDGNLVRRQVPAPGSDVLAGSRLYLLTGELNHFAMPNLSGWSLKEVKDWAGVVGLRLHSAGHGYVVEQSVAPGERVRPGDQVSIILQPKQESQ